MGNFKMIFKLNYLFCLSCLVVHYHPGHSLPNDDTGGEANVAEASSSPKLTFPSDYLIFSYRLSANMKRLSQHWKSKEAMKHMRKELYLIWSNKLATDTMKNIVSEFERIFENENARNAIVTVVQTVSSILRRVTVRNFVYLLDYYKSLNAKPALLEAYSGLVRELVDILSDPPKRKLLLTLLTTQIREKKVQKQNNATTLTTGTQKDGSDNNELEKSVQEITDKENPAEETLEGYEKDRDLKETTETPGPLDAMTNEESKVSDDGYDSHTESEKTQSEKSLQDTVDEIPGSRGKDRDLEETTEASGSLNGITNEESKVPDDGYDSNSDNENSELKQSSQDKAVKEAPKSHGKDQAFEDIMETPGSPNVINNEESKVSDDDYDSNSDHNDLISTTSDDLNDKIDETNSDDEKLTEKMDLANSSELSRAGAVKDETNPEIITSKELKADVESDSLKEKSKIDIVNDDTDIISKAGDTNSEKGGLDRVRDGKEELEDLLSEKPLVLDDAPIHENEVDEKANIKEEHKLDRDIDLENLTDVSQVSKLDEEEITTTSSEVSGNVADNEKISDREKKVAGKKLQKSTTSKKQPVDGNEPTIEENLPMDAFDGEMTDSELKKDEEFLDSGEKKSGKNVKIEDQESSAEDIVRDTNTHKEITSTDGKLPAKEEDFENIRDLPKEAPSADEDIIAEVEERVKESKEASHILTDSPDVDVSKLTPVDEKEEEQSKMKLANVDAETEEEEHLDSGKHGSVKESKKDISSHLDNLVDSPDANVSKLTSVDEKEEEQSKMKLADVDALTEAEEHLDSGKHGSVKESKEDISSHLDSLINSPDADVSKLTSVDEEKEEQSTKLSDQNENILTREKNGEDGHRGSHEIKTTDKNLRERGENSVGIDEQSLEKVTVNESSEKGKSSSTLLDDLDDEQNPPSIKHSSDSLETIVDSNLSEATDALEQKNPKTKSSLDKVEKTQENPVISSENHVHEKDINISHRETSAEVIEDEKEILKSKDHNPEMEKNISDDKKSDAARVVSDKGGNMDQIVEEESEYEEDDEEQPEIMKIGLLDEKEDTIEKAESGEILEDEEEDDDDSGVERDDLASSVEEGNTDYDSAETEHHINSEEPPIIDEKHTNVKKVEQIIHSEVLESETTAPRKESTSKKTLENDIHEKDDREKHDKIQNREIDPISEIIAKGEVESADGLLSDKNSVEDAKESPKNSNKAGDLEESQLETGPTKERKNTISNLETSTHTHNPNEEDEEYQNKGHEESSEAENPEIKPLKKDTDILSKTPKATNLGNKEDEESSTNSEKDEGQEKSEVPVSKLMEDGPRLDTEEPDINSTNKDNGVIEIEKPRTTNAKHPTSFETTTSKEFEERIKPSSSSKNDDHDSTNEENSKINNSEDETISKGPGGQNEHLNKVEEDLVENLSHNEDLGLDELFENSEEKQTINDKDPTVGESHKNIEERDVVADDLGDTIHSEENLHSDKTKYGKERTDAAEQHDSIPPNAEKVLDDEELPSEESQNMDNEPLNPVEENKKNSENVGSRKEDEDKIVKHTGKSTPEDNLERKIDNHTENNGEENVDLQHSTSNDKNTVERDIEESVRTSGGEKIDDLNPEFKNNDLEEENEDNTSQKRGLQVREEEEGHKSTKQKDIDEHLPDKDSTTEKMGKVNLEEDLLEKNIKTSKTDGKVEEIQSDEKKIETEDVEVTDLEDIAQSSDGKIEHETDNVDLHDKSDAKMKSAEEIDVENIKEVKKISTDKNGNDIIVKEKSKSIKSEEDIEDKPVKIDEDSNAGNGKVEEVHEKEEQKNSTSLDIEPTTLAEKNDEISDHKNSNSNSGKNERTEERNIDKKFDDDIHEENNVNADDEEDSKGQTRQSTEKTAEDEKGDTMTKDLSDDAHIKNLAVEKEATESANDDLLPEENSVSNKNKSNDESTLQNIDKDHTSVLKKDIDADSAEKMEDIENKEVKATLQEDPAEPEDEKDTVRNNLKTDVQELDAEKVPQTDKDDSKIEDLKTSEAETFEMESKHSNVKSIDEKNSGKDAIEEKIEAPDKTGVDNLTPTSEDSEVCAIPTSNAPTDSSVVTSPTGSPGKNRFSGMKTFFSNIGRKFTSQ